MTNERGQSGTCGACGLTFTSPFYLHMDTADCIADFRRRIAALEAERDEAERRGGEEWVREMESRLVAAEQQRIWPLRRRAIVSTENGLSVTENLRAEIRSLYDRCAALEAERDEWKHRCEATEDSHDLLSDQKERLEAERDEAVRRADHIQAFAKQFYHCDTHGQMDGRNWGCPDCVHDLRRDWRSAESRLAIAVGALKSEIQRREAERKQRRRRYEPTDWLLDILGELRAALAQIAKGAIG